MIVTTEHRYRLHPQASHRKVAGEVFVVTGDRAFHRLQAPTSVDLFDAMTRAESGATPDELVQLLLHTYDVSEATARADVALFLETLVARQLAIPAPPPASTAAPHDPVQVSAAPQQKVTP